MNSPRPANEIAPFSPIKEVRGEEKRQPSTPRSKRGEPSDARQSSFDSTREGEAVAFAKGAQEKEQTVALQTSGETALSPGRETLFVPTEKALSASWTRALPTRKRLCQLDETRCQHEEK